jgi:hypothetical protein
VTVDTLLGVRTENDSMDVKFLLFALFPWQSKGREVLILRRALPGDGAAPASHTSVYAARAEARTYLFVKTFRASQ